MAFKAGSFKSDFLNSDDDSSSPFASSFLDGGNFLDSSRAYRARKDYEATPELPGEGVFDSSGTEQILGGAMQEHAAEQGLARGALDSWASVKAAEDMAAAQRAAASAQAGASRTGSIIGAVGSIGGAVAGALI
jgi:hypothetical protein